MTSGIYVPKSTSEHLGRLENAFKIVKRAEVAEDKIRRAVRKKILPKQKLLANLDGAVQQGIITGEEKADIIRSEEVRWDSVQVDDFTTEEYFSHFLGAGPESSKAGARSSEKNAMRVI
jgi:hypothetical protein